MQKKTNTVRSKAARQSGGFFVLIIKARADKNIIDKACKMGLS